VDILPNARETPQSGAIRGFGGDITFNIRDNNFLVEVKKDNIVGKKMKDIYDKVKLEALQCLKEPIVIEKDFVVMSVSTFMGLLYDKC
jgi:hypothetical protein